MISIGARATACLAQAAALLFREEMNRRRLL